jgi:acetylornithine deacetylase
MDQPLAQMAALDAAVEARADRALDLLVRLVAEPSGLGEEAGAQRVLAAELEALGFGIEWLPVPEDIAQDPAAGVPSIPYAGRHVLVGRLPGRDPGGAGRSLLVNGHLDVVPAGEPRLWRHPPFEATPEAGWLLGRGAGDMKAGFAMVAQAVGALLAVDGPPAGDLTVVAVLEEECTGNGTLASVRAGVGAGAHAVLLPEPTDLDLLVGGVGVLWVEIVVDGRPGHAEAATAGVSALDGALAILAGLRSFGEALNAEQDGPARYHVNVGTLRAGEWPSSVPGSAVAGVRIGFPAAWAPDEAERRVREAIDRTAAEHPWLAGHPPAVRLSGFRAQGYAVDPEAPVIAALRAAHEEVHGTEPALVSTNGTTDARFYVNQAGLPAVCFGPRTRNMHGVDEAVEIRSITDGARTLARFLRAWLNEPERAAA